MQPAIPKEAILDQFAFRPTGSTTAAPVYFMHHVTLLLETNLYVMCRCTDLTKSFWYC